jgi:uncharacterized protein YidB (DUF937 family)
MGLFDEIVSTALRGAMGQAESQLLPGLLQQLLANTNLGSIGGLLQQLQQGGLSNEVASWLGNGANHAISPDQLRSALGNEHLQQLAQASGLPLDKLLAMLSQQLPQTVDKMSPNGKLQDSNDQSNDEDDSDDSRSSSGGNLADQAGLGDIGRR